MLPLTIPTTTIAFLRTIPSCKDGYRKVVEARPDVAYDAALTMDSLLDSNDVKDVTWLLGYLGDDGRRVLRFWGSWCAWQVVPVYERYAPTDDRIRRSILVTRDWCDSGSEADAAALAASAFDAAALATSKNLPAAWAAKAAGLAWTARDGAVALAAQQAGAVGADQLDVLRRIVAGDLVALDWRA